MESSIFEGKKQCLISEIKTAFIFFEKGMKDLKDLTKGMDRIRYDNGWLESIYVPIQLLSSSLERLIKCLLCIILLKENGGFEEEPFKIKKRKGHKLDYLLDRLIKVITNTKYMKNFSIGKSDIKYMQEDIALKQIVKSLSDFGLGARYYNLDIVLNGESEYKSPIEEWDRIEMTILYATRGFDEATNIPHDAIMLETQKDIIKVIDKLFNIIGKLLKLAGLGDIIKKLKY